MLITYTGFRLQPVRLERVPGYGLFPPTEMEMDSFPNGYIVLSRTFSTESDPDMDPCMETFPDGYCTHFRDGSLSQ